MPTVNERKRRKMQFISDRLVDQIIGGRKTASVVRLGEVDKQEDEYDNPLVIGEYYDVYDSTLVPRCTIRIIAMELCRWDHIPEWLWRGEANKSAHEFREDHRDYFDNPRDDFEFVGYHFELVKTPSSSAKASEHRPKDS